MTASVTPQRRATVNAACEGWIRKLIDPSRRNNLLFFRDLKLGTFDLSQTTEDSFASLLAPACEAVSLEQFVTKKEDVPAAAARLQEIRSRALTNREERGLETLFVALGIATWSASDGGKPYASPVLLMPIAIEQRGSDRRRLALRRAGDVQVNLVLTYHLESQGIRVDPAQILTLVEGDDENEQFDLTQAFEVLNRAGAGLPEFRVERRFVLGNFSFQKMAMVQDLRGRVNELSAHDVVAAIAQDASARAVVTALCSDVDPRDIDRQLPDQEFLVLDADSTQQRAICGALSGQNGVISGPPGTGKSQTISNLIAESAARGLKVLFVAEKRAALEAVLRRLEQKGVGHLCLDLHGADVSRRDTMKRVAEGLDRVRDAAKVDPTELHRRFLECRKKLNAHVQRMHTTHAPSALTVYELQGRLLRLPPEAVCDVRWRNPELESIDSACAGHVCDLLEELGAFETLFLRSHPSPWTNAVLDSASVAQRMHDLARDLSKSLPLIQRNSSDVMSGAGLSTAADWNGLEERLRLLCDINGTLAQYQADILTQDMNRLATDLRPAERPIAHLWGLLTSGKYRAARRTALALRRASPPPAGVLLREVLEAAEIAARWKALRSGYAGPSVTQNVETLQKEVEVLCGRLESLFGVLPGRSCSQEPLDSVRSTVDALAADSITPSHVVRVRELEAELRAKGVGTLLDDIRASKANSDSWQARFRFAWLRSWLDAVQVAQPELGRFKGSTHQKTVDEFKRLDEERIRVAIARVQRTHAERVISVRNQFRDQDALVRREAGKKRRHLPLRELFRQAPDVLTALHPCWMASPLSVSQLIPGDRQYFDLVVFDEASQVLPEDAVTSLLRGHRTVVAGDQRQLPPTTFFAAGLDEADEEDQATGGFESLLDVMSSLLSRPWGLDWHYRSKDESLIAFSNRHIYGDRLVTFPSAGGELAVRHVLVNETRGANAEDSNSAEVDEVVRLTMEHAETRPHETLGVIAMGIAHARRVEAAVDRAAQERPHLAEFFDTKRSERFFVKNLERVQGDERDAIILTIGYGKDSSGRLLYRFGPLLTDGGERRLNVAVTRARRRMTVVSSFSHLDMDPSRSKAKGVELLRAYLEYAATNGVRLGDPGAVAVPLNDFEQAVHDALVRRGLDLIPQWGASQYRIDLVAKHPSRPGQFVLAIECDGASYHSAVTARERDRLRQQHLEALGWRFHRIWSTDWFLDPESEIARVEKAFAEAVAASEPGQAMSGQTNSRVRSGAPVVDRIIPRRPPVPQRDSIDEYAEWELDRLVKWINESGLKTDEEIVSEATRELGFTRRGTRIEAAIRAAIARVGGGGERVM